MKFIKENKGQSGTVFRLMIDGIIGLAIFMMILTSLNYFQNLRMSTSTGEVITLLTSAINSPNGVVFSSNGELLFAKGSGFTATNLRNQVGIDEQCFEFETNLGFAKILGDGKQIDFVQAVQTRVYSKCVPSGEFCEYGASDCCEIMCTLSFGEPLVSDIEFE